MSLKLTPIGPASGPSVLLQRPVLLVGRHPECDWRLNLPKISRRHCCFALANDRVLLRDLGSRNGVRVNGREIAEVRLARGDEVAIGPLLFRVDEEPDDASAPPRAERPPTPRERPDSGDEAPEIDLIPLDDV